MSRHVMPSLAAALAMTLLACGLAPRAAEAAGEARGAYAAYLIGGYGSIDSDEVERRFEASGYPGFPRDMAAFGIGVLGGRRTVFGVDFVGLVSSEDEVLLPRGRHQVAHGAWSVVVHLGLRLVHTDRVSLYPLVGAGYGAMTTEIKPLDAVAFDSVLVQTGGKASLEGGTAIAETGIGFDYAFGQPSDSNERFVLGLRAGYGFAFGHPQWMQDDIEARGGPDGSLEGPFVRLTVGSGRWP